MKMKVEVIDATENKAVLMLNRMRSEDQAECLAYESKTANVALLEGVMCSEYCKIVLLDGTPVACFGVRSVPLAPGYGVPWMLATEEFFKIRRFVVRYSKKYIHRMLLRFPMLVNYVHKKNKVSVRWLRWCGFKFEKARSAGPAGELFYRFTMGV